MKLIRFVKNLWSAHREDLVMIRQCISGSIIIIAALSLLAYPLGLLAQWLGFKAKRGNHEVISSGVEVISLGVGILMLFFVAVCIIVALWKSYIHFRNIWRRS